MSNQQFDEVERLIEFSKYSSHVCPTCEAKAVKVEGAVEWPESYFTLWGKKYDCDCQLQQTLMRHYLLAHLPEEYWVLNEKDYYGDPEAWNAMETYLANWRGMKANSIGLEFYSKVQGTGKTMLATQIAKYLIKRGERVYFIAFRSIMDLFTKPYEVRKLEQDRLHYDTILILDDIIAPISEAQQHHFGDKFEELIRDRTNYGRITILTTNLLPAELGEFYPRTYSLLSARQIRVAIDGNDVRKGDVGKLNLELGLNNERRPIS